MYDLDKIAGLQGLLNTQSTATMSEANQNFSKVARMAEQASAVILLKNSRPKFLLIDLDQFNQKTRSFSPEEFLEVFNREGVWVLRDAQSGVKRLLARRYPEKYEVEVHKNQVIQKLLKIKDDLVIVTLNHPEWAGVTKLPLNEVKIAQDDEGILTLTYHSERPEEVLSIRDYGSQIMKTFRLLNGKEVRGLAHELDFGKFNQALIESGYVTAGEIQICSHQAIRDKLPLVRTVFED